MFRVGSPGKGVDACSVEGPAGGDKLSQSQQRDNDEELLQYLLFLDIEERYSAA